METEQMEGMRRHISGSFSFILQGEYDIISEVDEKPDCIWKTDLKGSGSEAYCNGLSAI